MSIVDLRKRCQSMTTSQSPCCNTALVDRVITPRVEVRRCVACGTYWCDHKTIAAGRDAWKSSTVSPRFLEALRYRRGVQAEQIFSEFKDVLSRGTVLDYGC